MAGIKVVATRKGFFDGILVAPGTEFTIKDKSQMGTWMELVKQKPKAKPVKVEPKAEAKEEPKE